LCRATIRASGALARDRTFGASELERAAEGCVGYYREEAPIIDVVVAGYPKSGTTWVVQLVAELIGGPVVGFWDSGHDEIAREGSRGARSSVASSLIINSASCVPHKAFATRR
jgi:hypothetical protein